MQWLIDQAHWLLSGTGVLGFLGSIVTLRTWGRRLRTASVERDSKMLDRINKLEDDMKADREKLAHCEAQHSECRGKIEAHGRQMAARDRALDLLARELDRRSPPVRRA